MWLQISAVLCLYLNIYTQCKAESFGPAENLYSELLDGLKNEQDELTNPKLWPNDFAKEVLNYGLDTYDFIVVGAGSAGSVVASRLSEDPSVKVLVLEAGANPPEESEIPALFTTIPNSAYAWNDYAEPSLVSCQGMIDNRCFWPHGKMLGGTGSMNGNIFLLGTQNNFERWEKQGNNGWSWSDIHQFYRKAIKKSHNSTRPVGSLNLGTFKPLSGYKRFLQLMFDGTMELGIPKIDKSTPDVRSGYTVNSPVTATHGVRMSTGKTYLGIARNRANLHVIKNAYVTRINFDSELRAVGLDFLLQNRFQYQVNVSREIIVSAGSINSPPLLLRSGIGPEDQLKKLGIQPIKNLQVGENLQDHGMLLIYLKFGQNISMPDEDLNLEKIADYWLDRSGPLSTRFNLMGFVNTTDLQNNDPDLQIVTHTLLKPGSNTSLPVLRIKPEIWQELNREVLNFTRLEMTGCLLYPKSRGRVFLPSAEAPPAIDFNLGYDSADQATLVGYVRYVQRLLRTQAFRKYELELIHVPIAECDTLPYDTDIYWNCYTKYLFISAWHPVGTNKMGPSSDSTAVVDSRLRVHGVQNLRVCDASIMPEIVSGNPNGVTIVIAEKAAQMIKDDWQNRPI